ncbi:fungal-specific transcription factor domain-containing protein [Stachybotrys elegans]|uniref:Fungal-specific transcription factor domain-containing protein n=1 Tax=Stachybotrys elegans TaxID=80388 RepID=A0A8K0SIG1_9HYPO|nr:fungal-specific transcription factor domain-containing protein [Stachybotrys elegans]
MHNDDAVLAALLSLAGLFVHDYYPSQDIRDDVHKYFSYAESCLSKRMSNISDTVKTTYQIDRTVTLLFILSYHDLMLPERRVKSLADPRWYIGFRQCEALISQTEARIRGFQNAHLQLSSLRKAQYTLVTYHTSIAESLLPVNVDFEVYCEADRFSWSLWDLDTESCKLDPILGFPRMALYIFSQITFLNNRVVQEPRTTLLVIRMPCLRKMLLQLAEEAAGDGPIGKAIAQAWLLSTMLYLNCRLLRVPRTDDEVMRDVNALAACVARIPTSGATFTGTIPIFPVFILGLLSKFPPHRVLVQEWLFSVANSPVRSNVPLLLNCLRGAWTWIDKRLDPLIQPELPDEVVDRTPWWEEMVKAVRDQEKATLCLT